MKSISRTIAQYWLALAIASVTFPLRAQFDAAQVVASEFRHDADGWTAVDREQGTGAYLRLHSTADQLSAGAEGLIQASPGDGDLYFRAPSKFLGDKSTAFGGYLNFYVGEFGEAAGSEATRDVILSDGSTTLCHNIQTAPDPINGGRFSIAYRYVLLVETGWSDLGTGLPATRRQMLSVLSSLAVLDIRAGFGPKAAETNALVWVQLTAGCPFATIRLTSATEVEIRWRSQLDWIYRAEYRSSLRDGDWMRMGDFIIGTGGDMCVRDAIAREEPQRFYRVCTTQ